MNGAAAAIFDGAGRLLLIKENYDRRRYSLPGGRVEPGETPEEAVVREVREETGVGAQIDGRVGLYQLDNGFEVALYACSIVDGIPAVPEGDEIAEVGWFDPADIPEPRSNVLHHALADVLAGARDVERRGLERIN